jgi:hypothetical protein
MNTLTYTIKFNPETGSKRPYEVWCASERGDKVCSSSATLKGAEKSRQGYAKPRMQSFNVITPEFAA